MKRAYLQILWREVFDYLSVFEIGKIHLALACNELNRETMRSMLYKYTIIDQDSVVNRFAREWFAWMQKHSIYIQCVAIGHPEESSVNDDDIVAFVNHSGQRLLSFFLCVIGGPTSDRSVVHLAQACPRLRHFYFSTNMTDIGLDALAQYCPDLDFKDISSADHSNITTAGFLSFQRRRPKVARFQLFSNHFDAGCDFYLRLSSEEIIEWIRISCSAEITKHAYINTLEVREDDVHFDQFNDDVLIALVEQCPHLQSFCLKEDLSVVTNRGIRFLASNCKSLVDFSLSVCQDFVDYGYDHTSIVECLSKCPIHTLNLTNCSEMIQDELLREFPVFPKVRNLTFSVGWTHLSNTGMELISEKFPNLEELEIRNFLSLPFVTDDGVDVVIQKCPFLKKLRIENAAITQGGFDRWMLCGKPEHNITGHLAPSKIRYAQQLLRIVNHRPGEEFLHLRGYYDKEERYFTVASMEWRKNGGDGYEISKFHDEDDAYDCYLDDEDDISYEEEEED